MTVPWRCTAIALSLALGCSWLDAADAQEGKKKPPAKKEPKNKLTPDELRTEVERKLPTGDDHGIFLFVAIDRAFKEVLTADKKGTGVKFPRTTKTAHSMNDRKEAIEFLVKFLAEGQSGGVRIKRENGKNILMGDLDAALRNRRWEFVASFPNTEAGQKDAASRLATLQRQLAAEEKEELKKDEERRKLMEKLDKEFKKKGK